MRRKKLSDFNAIVRALTTNEQQLHRDEEFGYKCHKPGHRVSKCPMLQTESTDNADNQY
jgi:hypothetical protein